MPLPDASNLDMVADQWFASDDRTGRLLVRKLLVCVELLMHRVVRSHQCWVCATFETTQADNNDEKYALSKKTVHLTISDILAEFYQIPPPAKFDNFEHDHGKEGALVK